MKSKSSLVVIMVVALVLSLAFAFSACDKSDAKISFDSNGGSEVASVDVYDGKAQKPNDPIKSGYVFDGWYFDNQTFSEPCDFGNLSGKLSDFTVYAKWVQEGLKFTKLGTQAYYVSSYVGTKSEIIIPTQYNGLPVTTIASGAFSANINLLSIEIPTTITSISTRAFDDCAALVIYCQVAAKPANWKDDWNIDGVPVVWNCKRSSLADNGYTYFFAADGNRYAYVGTTAVLARYVGAETSVTVASSVRIGALDYTVNGFGNACFFGNTTLTSVAVPSTLTMIGDNVFSGCTALADFNMTNITSIGKYAFNNCVTLTDLYLPSTLSSIGSEAFNNCTSLTIYCASENRPLGWNAYWALNSATSRNNPVYWGVNSTNFLEDNGIQYVLKNGKATVSRYVGNATTLSIPETVTIGGGSVEVAVIGSEAFSKNATLRTIELSDKLSSVEFGAFLGCSSLETLNIPAHIASIGNEAFAKCSAMTSIIIPASCTYIGADVFENSPNVVIKCEVGTMLGGWRYDWNYENGSPSARTVVWGVNNITTNVNYNYVVHDNEVYLTRYKGSATSVSIPARIDGKNVVAFGNIFQANTQLRSITIPNTVLRVSDYAFYKCFALTSVSLPKSVLSIGEYAFAGTKETGEQMTLQTIFLDYEIELETVGAYAFAYCAVLNSFSMPQTTYSIGEGAFLDCSSLTNIVLRNEVASIGADAFKNCDSLTIYCQMAEADVPEDWNTNWNPTSETVLWEQDTDQSYTVEYYYQNINDDNYTKVNSEIRVGAVNSTVTVTPPTIDHYTYTTVEGQTLTTGTVLPGGARTFKLYYNRVSYTVTFSGDGGTLSDPEAQVTYTVRYGASISAPEFIKVGYHYEAWTTDITNIASNGEISPIWEANTDTAYSVEYYFQNVADDEFTLDGTLTQALSGTTAQTATVTPTAPEHFTLSDTLSTLSAEISADGSLVLKVYYTRNSYTVTFVANGGTKTETSADLEQTVKYAASATAPTLEYAGYTQDGWNAEFANVSADLTINALWTANTDTAYIVKVYFENVSDDEYTEDTAKRQNLSGTTDTTATFETSTYAHFTVETELSTLSGNIDGDGSLVLSVYYKRDRYDVTFVANGATLSSGSAAEQQTIKYASAAVAPTYTYAGYSFSTWSAVFDSIDADLTVNAQWTANSDTAYVVNYYYENVNDTGFTLKSEETENLSGTTDTTATTAPTAPEHFTLNETKSVLSGNIDGNGSRVLSVYYNRVVYTVTFSANGGTHVLGFETQRIKYQGTVSAVTYSKTGYHFTDWFVALTNVSQNFETYPLWLANDNILYFRANGGKGTMENMSIKTAESATLTTNSFTRDGYTFAGWANTANGVKVYDDGATYSMGTNTAYELFALWTTVPYTIDYTLNGGTVSGLTTSYNVETATFALPSPSRTGYTFKGWFDNASFSGNSFSSVTVGSFGNKTFFAKWEADTYHVYYTMNGGTNNVANLESYTIETANFNLETPTLSGCSFVGWYDVNGVNGNIVTSIRTNNLKDYHVYAVWQYVSDGIKYILADGKAEMSGMTVLSASITIPSTLVFGEETFNITSIADYAFDGVTNLVSVTIGEGITTIGEYAFNCCTSLKYLSLPSTLIAIDEFAFYGCSALTSVILPENLATVGTYAFADCTYTAFFAKGASAQEGWDTSWKDNTVGSNYWNMTDANFVESDGFMFVYYGSKTILVRYTGNGTNVVIPTSVSFNGVDRNIDVVGSYSFANCTTLAIVDATAANSFNGQAFYGCSGLTTITLPFIGASPTASGTSALFGFIFGWTEFGGSTAVTQNYQNSKTKVYYIPTALKTVNLTARDNVNGGTLTFGAFSGCTMLTTVSVCDYVSIGDYTFYGCTGLTSLSVTLQDVQSTMSFGSYAFSGCSGLTAFTITADVAIIGQSAFGGCTCTINCCIAQADVPVGWDVEWNVNNCVVVWEYVA